MAATNYCTLRLASSLAWPALADMSLPADFIWLPAWEYSNNPSAAEKFSSLCKDTAVTLAKSA